MSAKIPHIHITGICGVATSALAIAFHKKGWKVTGSDKGFFPPVSTALEEAGVSFYAGWHPEKMIENGVPDFVIIATGSGTQNPETQYAKDHNIPIKSDAEVRGEFFAKKNSIVCVGTWGKTSSTALLSHILREAKYDPSFVIGGLSLSTDAAYLGDSEWSVIEGDEYKSSPWDIRPKFIHAHPTHVLLSAVSWDHADIYPTEESYFKVFEDLVQSIPTTGTIVACADHAGVSKILNLAQAPVTSYGSAATAHYRYHTIQQSTQGLTFTISHGNETYNISSPMLGEFQIENITGCFAMAHSVGIPSEHIIAAIASFQGLKRRLEKRYEGNITVIDDIAHSPEKSAAILSTLRKIYPKKIVVIFEPNIGGRRHESQAKYDNAFKDADVVIIPRLTKLKIAADEKEAPFEGDQLAAVISKTHPNTHHIADDEKLVAFIQQYILDTPTSVIAFLGSHGFRGMIETTTEILKQQQK